MAAVGHSLQLQQLSSAISFAGQPCWGLCAFHALLLLLPAQLN
jgi:hypothetical protein